jgi:plasmid stability protein
MRNITVAVPDDVYREARIRAAEMGRSVSALVSEFLTGLSQKDAEFERLRAQRHALLEEIDRYEKFDGSDLLSRDELYDRAIR